MRRELNKVIIELVELVDVRVSDGDMVLDIHFRLGGVRAVVTEDGGNVVRFVVYIQAILRQPY